MPERLTKTQRRKIVKLHTLWGHIWKQVSGQSDVPGPPKAARLAWVGAQIGRAVESFNELTEPEMDLAMEKMIACLPPELVTHRPRRRRRSKKAGAIAIESARQSPSAGKLALIEELLRELAAAGASIHDRASLEEWLRVGRSAPARRLATQRDADRIIPALRNMARRCRGASSDAPAADTPAGRSKDRPLQASEGAEAAEVHG